MTTRIKTMGAHVLRIATLLLACVTAAPAVAQSVAVHLLRTEGISQTAITGRTLETRHQVRVLDAQDQPVAGVTVRFSVNLCLDFPEPPPDGSGGCPPMALYGHFPDGSLQATAVSDAQGFATAPAFTAGEVAGTYSLFPTVPSPQIVNGRQIVSGFATLLFSVTQVQAGSAEAVPAAGVAALGGLGVLLLLLARRTLARRESGARAPAR